MHLSKTGFLHLFIKVIVKSTYCISFFKIPLNPGHGHITGVSELIKKSIVLQLQLRVFIPRQNERYCYLSLSRANNNETDGHYDNDFHRFAEKQLKFQKSSVAFR